MLGRILISLISCVLCDLRARLAFFWASYLYLPTSRNFTTGGSAFGDTSTRSRPTPAACSIASCVNIRSEEHTSELQSLMRISYAVFCLKKKKKKNKKCNDTISQSEQHSS